MTPRTWLIDASHISSTTALTCPVHRWCARAREQGVQTMIDGAHAPGHVMLNLNGLQADFYTGHCHPSLCAPKGSAFMGVPAAIAFQQRNGLAPAAPYADHGQRVVIPVRCADAEAEALLRRLVEQHRIEVPVTRHAGHTVVRVSVQTYTTLADLDAR